MEMLPSDIRLSAAELRLAGTLSREYALDRALASLRPDYDYILIDCQPSLGLLTINALTAADTVVVPTECEFLALRGVQMLLDTIGKVKERLNPRLRLCGVLPTMVDVRSSHSRDTMATVVDLFGDLVFHSAIARAVRFPESSKAGVPVVVAEPTSAGATSYRNLAWELVERIEGKAA
jgi:chromosome partitioning protein